MLFTNRDLYKIAIPLMLQSILATTIDMIDSLMMAGKEKNALAVGFDRGRAYYLNAKGKIKRS